MQLRKFSTIAVLSARFLCGQSEPAAGTWRTWVVPDVHRIRLTAPPNAADSSAEIQTIKTLMSEMNADTKSQIAYWDAGPPGYRWMQLASQQMLAQNVAAPLFTRGMALVGVAVYDATKPGLPLVASENITTPQHEVSGLAVMPTHGNLWEASSAQNTLLTVVGFSTPPGKSIFAVLHRALGFRGISS